MKTLVNDPGRDRFCVGDPGVILPSAPGPPSRDARDTALGRGGGKRVLRL
jgi:hypothetical protein